MRQPPEWRPCRHQAGSSTRTRVRRSNRPQDAIAKRIAPIQPCDIRQSAQCGLRPPNEAWLVKFQVGARILGVGCVSHDLMLPGVERPMRCVALPSRGPVEVGAG